MGRFGVPFGGEAEGAEGAKLSGASSEKGVQAQEADGPRAAGESNAFANPESSGTCVWGAGEAGGEADRTSYRFGEGKS